MGGRGSGYINFYNASHSSGADIDIGSILADEEEDKDTEKEYNGKTKILKDKCIHIKESTDTLPEDVFVPNITKVDQLTNKYIVSANILKENNKELAIRAKDLHDRDAVAAFVSSGTEFDRLRIVFNKGQTFPDRASLEKTTQEQIDKGFWVKSDKEELVNQTITHEFGHYVQRVLMEKDKETKSGKLKFDKLIDDLKTSKSSDERHDILSKYSEDYATKYFRAIQRIHRKVFNEHCKSTDVSGYAREEGNREAFAELFANLNTTKQPNNLAKSMGIFLDKHLVPKETNKNTVDKADKKF